MQNDQRPADDPLDRPLAAPIAPIPGVDVDVKAETHARIIGARIPRPHRPTSGWEETRIARKGAYSLDDPIDRFGSELWDRISRWIYVGGIGAAILYPVAILRGGEWISVLWPMFAISVIGLPFALRVDGDEHHDVGRRRAAHGLGQAPLTAVLSWWGLMTTPLGFAIAFPLVFALHIAQIVMSMKEHLTPKTRRRVVTTAVVLWCLFGAAAIAKLVFMSHGGKVDDIPAIVPLAVAFLCLAQAIRTAEAPPSVAT